jgi:hypothetical protein
MKCGPIFLLNFLAPINIKIVIKTHGKLHKSHGEVFIFELLKLTVIFQFIDAFLSFKNFG